MCWDAVGSSTPLCRTARCIVEWLERGGSHSWGRGGGERKIWGGVAVVPGGALWDDSCKSLLYPSLGYGNRERESKHRQARERLAHCLHDPQPSHRCLCFSIVLEGRGGETLTLTPLPHYHLRRLLDTDSHHRHLRGLLDTMPSSLLIRLHLVRIEG